MDQYAALLDLYHVLLFCLSSFYSFLMQEYTLMHFFYFLSNTQAYKEVSPEEHPATVMINAGVFEHIAHIISSNTNRRLKVSDTVSKTDITFLSEFFFWCRTLQFCSWRPWKRASSSRKLQRASILWFLSITFLT